MSSLLNCRDPRCSGWNPWYAPPDPSLHYKGGASLGNSWRIHGDGKNWTALCGAVNTMAQLANYTGPGGWNDPDLLIGRNASLPTIPKVDAGTPTSKLAPNLIYGLFFRLLY